MAGCVFTFARLIVEALAFVESRVRVVSGGGVTAVPRCVRWRGVRCGAARGVVCGFSVAGKNFASASPRGCLSHFGFSG